MSDGAELPPRRLSLIHILYRVESFDEGYTEPKVTLRRIKDGTIFDVEAPVLFLTPTGVQLLWPREVNCFCSAMELSLIHI